MKATIVSPRSLELLPEVPVASPLILDLGGDGYEATKVQEAEKHGHRVERLVAAAPDLDDQVLDALAGQPLPATVRVAAMPDVRTALRRARAVGRAHLVVELPVESDADLATLKVLSSLGVVAGVDSRRLFRGGEVMLELLTDALLRPGRRSPVKPVDDLQAHFDDDDFELGRIDLRANDHHVDLRDGTKPAPDAWSPVDTWRKREAFLSGRHACAFCEGLPFCLGALQPDCGEACRGVFSELFELQAVRKRRDAAKPSGGANRKEACGC